MAQQTLVCYIMCTIYILSCINATDLKLTNFCSKLQLCLFELFHHILYIIGMACFKNNSKRKWVLEPHLCTFTVLCIARVKTSVTNWTSTSEILNVHKFAIRMWAWRWPSPATLIIKKFFFLIVILVFNMHNIIIICNDPCQWFCLTSIQSYQALLSAMSVDWTKMNPHPTSLLYQPIHNFTLSGSSH